MQIKDSVFIVTGGGSGLGEATVRRLHGGGARVLIADVASERGEALAAALGAGAAFQHTDVTGAADGEGAVAAARQLWSGRLDGLVNCAGVAAAERVVGRNGPHRLETFNRCIQINLVGTFNMVRCAAAAMSEQTPNPAGERGVIINTASIAAYEGQIGQAAYAASKAGVIGMTLPIARELARSGIRIVTIAPGLFLTPMIEAMPADVQEALGSAAPFPQRLGKPSEFAALAAHIVENEMLNGETIRLDGAARLAAK